MSAAQLGTVHRQHTEYIDDVHAPDLDAARSSLLDRYQAVRAATEALAAPLETEDQVIQTMPDVSPTKWHLAHTSWFFEQFLLVDGPTADPDYRVFHDRYAYLFNSYYVTVGDRHCRIKRGTLSRPTVDEIRAYRRHVDHAMAGLIGRADAADQAAIAPLLEIGLHHEQQHQELGYTDIKHVFACNPLYPAYREPGGQVPAAGGARPAEWLPVDAGLYEVGHDGEGFAYDNESPRHKVYLRGFAIADRAVTNGDFLKFVESGGYDEAAHWLSAGWAQVNADKLNWSHPFYWHRNADGSWGEFTLRGLVALDPFAPVCHLSYFEADAYARWKGRRLPTEFEWEIACRLHGNPADGGNFQEDGHLHPRAAAHSGFLGDCWEWTSSQYTAYPGYVAPPGALGEYNGKFMCNQFVLRGGSCVTPRSHVRPTYRNFFPPDARWQFTGLRLARDV